MSDAMIEVGAYRVAVRISGSGTPHVVCISSAGGAHGEWENFVPLVSADATVTTYGRPGLGGSDPLTAEESDTQRGGRWSAEQLRALLRAANLAPPYVLVSGSIGAFVADQFAASWPDEIAGLVLIDPSPLRRLPVTNDRGDVFDTPGQVGGTRTSWEMSFDEQRERVPLSGQGRFVVLSSAVGRWLRNQPTDWHQPLSLAEVDNHWVAMQREWVDRLEAVQVIAETAGHLVHKEEPQLAALVVRAVIDAVKEDRPVEFDPASLAEVGARLRL